MVLLHTLPSQARACPLLACLLPELLSSRAGPRPIASRSACLAHGRFMVFPSLLSAVWLLVSMVKQEFPNGLFPIWAGQTLVMTLPAASAAAAVEEAAPIEPPFYLLREDGRLASSRPRPEAGNG